jgi:hypothetical protein
LRISKQGSNFKREETRVSINPLIINILQEVNPSYIPSTESEFQTWADNFATLLAANPATYGLTSGDAASVTAANEEYQAAFVVANNPATRTSPAIAQRASLRAALTAIVRPKAVLISSNQSVTPDDKLAIGVTLRTGARTPVTAPTVAPTLDVESVQIGTVTLRYGNAETPNSKAAPRGCGGVEVWAVWNPSDTSQPMDGVLLGIATKSPVVMPTSTHNATPCRVWVRWRTKNGVAGGVAGVSPFSAAVDFVSQ